MCWISNEIDRFLDELDLWYAMAERYGMSYDVIVMFWEQTVELSRDRLMVMKDLQNSPDNIPVEVNAMWMRYKKIHEKYVETGAQRKVDRAKKPRSSSQ